MNAQLLALPAKWRERAETMTASYAQELPRCANELEAALAAPKEAGDAEVPKVLRDAHAEAVRWSPKSFAGADAIRKFQILAGDYVCRLLDPPGDQRQEGQPPYPTGTVTGPCVCGSWPGGECLRCEWRPASPPTEAAAAVGEDMDERALRQAARLLDEAEMDSLVGPAAVRDPDGYTAYGEMRWACDCDERMRAEWTPVWTGKAPQAADELGYTDPDDVFLSQGTDDVPCLQVPGRILIRFIPGSYSRAYELFSGNTPTASAARESQPAAAEVDVVRIEKPARLDPITVYIEDEGVGRGRMTIICYNEAWTCYWGAMGNRRLREFVADCDAGYVAMNMVSGRNLSDHEHDYAVRIAAAVIAAIKGDSHAG